MDRFEKSTFESIEFMIESPETPKIKAGGSSSSNILNRFFNALSQDISLLATRANVLASRGQRIEAGCSAQAGALQAQLVALSARVNTVSALTKVFASMHATTYIDTVTSSGITFDYTFGQATLNPLSTTDLLIQEDVYGNTYISPEIQFSYSTRPAANVAALSVINFIPDSDGLFMLKNDQAWIKTKLTGETQGFIRIKAPLQFRGLMPNVLEIWPFPAFSMSLKKVSYRVAGSAEDTWYDVDLTYLPQYNADTGFVDSFGPVRLHLDNRPISELAIEVDITNSDVWGFKKLKLYHREYDSTGVLVAQDPDSRTIRTISIRGKDSSVLSTFSNTKTANKVAINVFSTDNASTPVITGVIIDVV